MKQKRKKTMNNANIRIVESLKFEYNTDVFTVPAIAFKKKTHPNYRSVSMYENLCRYRAHVQWVNNCIPKIIDAIVRDRKINAFTKGKLSTRDVEDTFRMPVVVAAGVYGRNIKAIQQAQCDYRKNLLPSNPFFNEIANYDFIEPAQYKDEECIVTNLRKWVKTLTTLDPLLYSKLAPIMDANKKREIIPAQELLPPPSVPAEIPAPIQAEEAPVSVPMQSRTNVFEDQLFINELIELIEYSKSKEDNSFVVKKLDAVLTKLKPKENVQQEG